MTKLLRNDPDRRMDTVVSMAPGDFPIADFDKLDRGKFPFWIEALRDAEASTRLLRRRLESMVEGTSRTCPICSRDVFGRADRVYCGATCRKRAGRGAPYHHRADE